MDAYEHQVQLGPFRGRDCSIQYIFVTSDTLFYKRSEMTRSATGRLIVFGTLSTSYFGGRKYSDIELRAVAEAAAIMVMTRV